MCFDSPGSLDLAGIAAGISDGITPGHSYLSAVPFGHRRRYAQFFTPVKIARLMAEWALAESTCTLLDPAIGMGVLVRAALARKPDLRVTAFEKDPTILRAYLSTQPDLNKIEVIFGDFLTLDVLSRFDAVIMNRLTYGTTTFPMSLIYSASFPTGMVSRFLNYPTPTFCLRSKLLRC